MQSLWAAGAIIIAVVAAVIIFIKPIKWLLKVVLNSVAGGIFLWLFNGIGGMFGFTIALNVVNILTVGILGLPGFILLILVRLLYSY